MRKNLHKFWYRSASVYLQSLDLIARDDGSNGHDGSDLARKGVGVVVCGGEGDDDPTGNGSSGTGPLSP